MLRNTALSRIRVPVVRRRRERFYEILNKRDFGIYEGSVNYWVKFAAAIAAASFILFEIALECRRILARGDTCPACEAARAAHRARVREREEMEEIQRIYQAKTDEAAAAAASASASALGNNTHQLSSSCTNYL